MYTTYVANSTTLNGTAVPTDGAVSPLVAGLPIDNYSARAAASAGDGVVTPTATPGANRSATAVITYQVKVQP